jgi:hypothetical protein
VPIVIASAVTASATVLVAILGAFFQRIRRDLEACERDRRQLKQVLQLVVGSIVGLLPERERLQLLRAVDDALEDRHS